MCTFDLWCTIDVWRVLKKLELFLAIASNISYCFIHALQTSGVYSTTRVCMHKQILELVFIIWLNWFLMPIVFLRGLNLKLCGNLLKRIEGFFDISSHEIPGWQSEMC